MRAPAVLILCNRTDGDRLVPLIQAIRSIGADVWLELSPWSQLSELLAVKPLLGRVDLTIVASSPESADGAAERRRLAAAWSQERTVVGYRLGPHLRNPSRAAACARAVQRYRDRHFAAVARVRALFPGPTKPVSLGIVAISGAAGVYVWGEGPSLDCPEVEALLAHWTDCVPRFVEQERRRRPADEVLDAAQVLATLRACHEVFGAVPTEEEMQRGSVLADKFNLFYRFVVAFHGAPSGELVPAGMPRECGGQSKGAARSARR